MDELTIADKKYLSSKKAAKLTGYAKDYVGQLCREGKVEARLVGRNWYVLENSILDHRFGTPSDSGDTPVVDLVGSPEITVDTEVSQKDDVEYTWKSPVYTSEPYNGLPLTTDSASGDLDKSDQSIPAQLPNQNSVNALSDMQSAWQEWFNRQKEAEKTLPDSSEMLLPPGDEIETKEAEDEGSRGGLLSLTEEQRTHIKKELEHEDISLETPIFINRETSIQPKESRNQQQEEVRVHRLPTETKQNRIKSSYSLASKGSKKPQTARKRQNGTSLLKVAILSVAGIFIAMTYLAFSMKTTAEMGKSNGIINFITGVNTISNTK